MALWFSLAGFALSFGGALVVALSDAWLTRSLLIYLDALEANLGRVVQALRAGATQLKVTGIDVKRDRGQDRARTVKTLAWLTLVLGFGLQIVAACMGRLPV